MLLLANRQVYVLASQVLNIAGKASSKKVAALTILNYGENTWLKNVTREGSVKTLFPLFSSVA